MGIFDFWKRKKNETVEESSTEQDQIDFALLSAEERHKYVASQCEIIKECSDFIMESKREYKIVGAYFSDIQMIETMPKEDKAQLEDLAKKIAEVSVDRRMYMAEESRISMTRYRQMSRDEETIVESLKKLQNDEAYLQVVKRDMNVLEGEKMSLRITAREMVERQQMIRKITMVSLFAFALIFLGMTFVGFYAKDNDVTAFFVILLLAAAFLAIDVAIYTNTIRETRITGKKLNKAITLLNKVKIKLFNTTNVIEYQYAKYDVKSSYELAEQYQLYLEAKKIKESYRTATIELTDLENQLMTALHKLPLHDPKIWLGQVKALYDTREMVEIRHGYSVRRQKLREQIEEAQKKIQTAQGILKDLVDEYPSISSDIMAVREQYQ